MPAPDGRFTPTWTRHLVGGAALFGIATIVFPMGWADPADWPPELQAAWLVSLPSADVIAQAMRRRGAVPSRETRPVIVSLVAALAAFVLLWAIQPELTPGALDLVVVTSRLRAVYALNLLVVLSVAVFLFPVSVAFSIVRYRLFDVDLLINRAIVYGGATTLVALSFLSLAVGITALANGGLTDSVSGRIAGPVGVGVGVGVVLVFQPLRRRVQDYVDRRFYRERYDAQQVIDGFSGDMTQLISAVQLERGLTGVVDQALRRLPSGSTPAHSQTSPLRSLAPAVPSTRRISTNRSSQAPRARVVMAYSCRSSPVVHSPGFSTWVRGPPGPGTPNSISICSTGCPHRRPCPAAGARGRAQGTAGQGAGTRRR